MKQKRQKGSLTKKTAALVLIRLLLAATAMALDPNPKDPALLDAIHQMRMRQEDEENVVRVISQPMQILQGNLCTPSEMARQRLREVGTAQNANNGTVNVQAGNGEVNVESNEGTVNSSVNVQIVEGGNERKCF